MINAFLDPYVFISGRGMQIEGVVRLIVWESERIVLMARERITVEGKGLVLEYKSDVCVLIRGRISSIGFSR